MEQEDANDERKSLKPSLTTSSWSRLKDPRIVRVSRAFGGKDRHSKVCTIRGLRDRRVRLSVPTAIQLYDLQDRLGLNQPSKAVDWLLDAAKNEINELPPLQIPPGSFGQTLQTMLNASSSSSHEGVRTSSNGLSWEDYWNPDKSKPIARETSENREEHDQNGTFVHSSSFLERNPNLSLSQFGSYGSVTRHQHDDDTVLPYHPPPLPPPPPPQTQLYFPSHNHNSRTTEFDPKQLNFQMVSSSSNSNFTPPGYSFNQGMQPFHLSMNPKLNTTERR